MFIRIGDIMKVQGPFVRSENNYDREKASAASAVRTSGKSRTKQAFKEECDINTIVRRFGITGRLPEGVRPPTYGDFTNIGSFHEAMNAIAGARESFDKMPAEVRARFQNDPSAFVDFCSKEENLPEMRKLGLAVPADPAKDANRPWQSSGPGAAAGPAGGPEAPADPAPNPPPVSG